LRPGESKSRFIFKVVLIDLAARVHEAKKRLLTRLLFACRYHAEEAIRLWKVVIERTGTSKFDVEKAKEWQKTAEEAFSAMRIIGPERDDTPRYREVFAEDSE
jgi:hypothetical protein